MSTHSVAEQLRKLQERALAFWHSQQQAPPHGTIQSQPWRFVHFWVLVFNSFQTNRGPVRASALAYTTLLALIPMLAVGVSVTTSFLKNDTARITNLVDKFISNVAPQLSLIDRADAEEVAVNRGAVVQKILGYINNVDSGKLGVTAVLALIFVAISLLATIEATFNDIWGVVRGRSWTSRVVHYWAALTLGPIFIVTALGFQTSMHLPRVKEILVSSPALQYASRNLIPLVILIGVFTLLYKQIPNTKVRWQAAFVGGAVGACLWQANSMFSAIYLSRVITYSKIYGSLGALPIFLIGIYFSWVILLLGAQVAYAWQNREAFAQEAVCEGVSQRGREFVAIRIMTAVAREFQAARPSLSRLTLAKQLAVPSQLVGSILQQLIRGKLLVEATGEEITYGPARPLDQISFASIIEALRDGGGTQLETQDDPARLLVRRELEKLYLAETAAANHVTLDTLAKKLVA